MSTRQKTIMLILGCAGVLIVWDCYAESQTEKDTISDIFATWARQTPMLACGWGVLMGHWFWPNP